MQIYNVSNLKNDINFVLRNNIEKINISSKPVYVKDIGKRFFKINLKRKKSPRIINMKSIHGKFKGYFMNSKKSNNDLKKFIKSSK